MYKQQSFANSNNQPVFNYETHSKELSDRFARLIKQLGPINKKGTARYTFEVDFMHALNEIKTCPSYIQGKMFDRASGIISALVAHIKLQQPEAQIEIDA